MKLDRQKLSENLAVACWTIACICYFFQFPFSELSIFIVPGLVGCLVLGFRNFYLPKDKKQLVLIAVLFAYMLFSIIRSWILGIPFGRGLRFCVVICLLPLCCCFRDKHFGKKWDIFIKAAAVKGLILVMIWLWVLREGDFTAIRSWAYANNYGDIYMLSRWNVKVQVQGNALLLVAFIIDFTKHRRFTLQNAFILAGILAAGNFAFILGLGLFFVWQASGYVPKLLEKGRISKRAISIALVCCLLVAVPYLALKIIQKAEVSNKTRIEQAEVLLEANPVIGEGLGNYIQKETSTRRYDGDLYFELQTLYIYNQVGLIGLGLAYCLTMWPLWRKSRIRAILYLIYLFFSFWNPYCWDATHIFTLLLLVNTNGLGARDEKGNYYSVFSFCKRQIKRRRDQLPG